jgi:peroxiredoxin family protein
MPPDNSGARPTKLSLIVFSGDYARVHYALATAAAALAIDIPVTLFFTMGGIVALRRMDGRGNPGWQMLPGATRNAQFIRQGIATFEELLAACRELRATFMVCEMGLRAENLTAADLRDDLTYEEGGLVTFLTDARADGSVVMI